MISRAQEAEVLRLYHAEHWPIGTIARQLLLHHSTVRRVLAQAGVPVAHKAPRPSLADPFIPLSSRRSNTIRVSVPAGCTSWCASAATAGAQIISAASSRATGRAQAPRRTCVYAPYRANKPKLTGHYAELGIVPTMPMAGLCRGLSGSEASRERGSILLGIAFLRPGNFAWKENQDGTCCR